MPKLNSEFSQEKLRALRLKQNKLNDCKKIFKETLFNAIFVWVLTIACYSNRNQMSYCYKNQIEKLFSGYKNVSLIKAYTT
jgi:hypothetical protein